MDRVRSIVRHDATRKRKATAATEIEESHTHLHTWGAETDTQHSPHEPLDKMWLQCNDNLPIFFSLSLS